MTKTAAERLYKRTGVNPSQVQVVELHDCFSANEMITYEALGLCAEGKAAEMIDNGDNTYGGKYVVNPSGGLISKGHPLGATGPSFHLSKLINIITEIRNFVERTKQTHFKRTEVEIDKEFRLQNWAATVLLRLEYSYAYNPTNVPYFWNFTLSGF